MPSSNGMSRVGESLVLLSIFARVTHCDKMLKENHSPGNPPSRVHLDVSTPAEEMNLNSRMRCVKIAMDGIWKVRGVSCCD